ncbi:MAG TPA: sugar ABC transporter ATP-binding protein [Planctomycetaceae bacterium]|nr:sugar ABC transporter ATP-binding protein [Planctomycetaceae bacterium]
MTHPLLRMTGIAKSFGATRALDGVSFEVRPGEVMALVGENGAGKSTLMKVLSGAYRPDAGRMEFDGRPYQPASPHQAREAGVAMIYQELNLCPDLSVEDNVMLGQESRHYGWLLDRRRQRPWVTDALERLGHPEVRPETPVHRLSIAARQLVEIARALVMDARLIVFDEPTSSLAGRDVEQLFTVIRRLRDAGIGIIYISHFLEEVRAVCDRYTVLRDGRSVGAGDLKSGPKKGSDPLPPLKETTEAEIVSLMVGRSVSELFPTVPHAPGEVVLSIDDVSGRALPRGVTLEVRRGEILGVAGLVGAGRTELLRCIFGLDDVSSGRVRVAGVAVKSGPEGRIAAGLGMVSEDRKTEGLAQVRSVADNLTFSRLGPYSRFGLLNLRRRDAAVGEWMQRLRVKARSPHQDVVELSGGNQQKVAIARVLHQQADVLLLDEPTRGIDVGTKVEIYRLIGEAAAAGKAVLFVSSYLPELLAICDRVAVMSRGRLRAVRPARDWTEEAVLHCAVGGSVLGTGGRPSGQHLESSLAAQDRETE